MIQIKDLGDTLDLLDEYSKQKDVGLENAPTFVQILRLRCDAVIADEGDINLSMAKMFETPLTEYFSVPSNLSSGVFCSAAR
jgi:hypothetical protein